MKKLFILLVALFSLNMVVIKKASAQLSYSYTFAATGTSGWTGNGTRTTANVCATTGSIRYNLYSSAPTMSFVSPILNTSLGALVTLSYQSKCVNFSTPTTGATANSVSTKVQYSASATGPWTDVAGSTFGNTTAATCSTRTVTFTPAAGSFYVRFLSTWSTGDVYLYLDEISITAPAPPACSGTPVPGNTISSATSVCSGVNFNLSVQNATSGSGVTYQWQSADDLAFTTNVTNLGTASTQTTSSTSSKYYRCGVTCSGSTGNSTPILVNVVNNPALCAPYCVPVGSCSMGDLIASVTLNTLVNVSGTTCSGDFVNYTTSTNPSHTTTLLPSSTYNCIVGSGAYAQDYAAWIDYNDDGTFASTERIGFTSTTLAANSTASFPITLACTPPAGPHRLRVRSAYATAGSAITPCGTQSYGETEDYVITIAAPPACPDLGALSVVSTTHNTANLSWVLNCANATAWDVQYGPTGFTLGNGTIVSNIPATTTATITGLTPLTAYQFYIRANCGAVTSNWSLVAAGTTLAAPCAGTPVAAVVSAPSFICSGASLALTATGLSTDAGFTYQWQSSTDSINWSPLVGATTTSYTIAAGITVNTWYRLVTTCTNSTLTNSSNEVGVKINPFYNCYTASAATNTANEEILGITLNGISNTSTCATVGPGPGSVLSLYSNYRTLGALTTMEQGGGYPINLNLGSCAGNFARAAKVWIDYNRNGVFENPGEMVYSTGDITAATANPTTNSGTVLVPLSAGLGLTGMRVSYFETTAANVVPTGAPSIYGEVEDYLVNITQLNSVITSVSPTTVCANVGTLIISGSGFFGATAVSVGGTPVQSYVVNSPNQITAIVGAGTDGVVTVTANGVTFSGLDIITVAPSPAAPTVSAATATVNFGESASFTASGTEITFNWYTSPNGGSPISSGAIFNTPGVCTNTTFYADQSTATCSGPRTPVSVVVQPLTLTVSPSNGLICSALDSATLSVTNIGGATYSWNNGLTGASVNVSPPTTTIYTVTVTSSTCVTSLTRNVGVISGVNLMPTVASSTFCYPAQSSDSIFSNLSAGNFGVSTITYNPSTQPATGVTTLATGGAASVPLSGGTLDDGGWGNIPIGFNYNFFGSSFNNLGVGTNGLVMFGTIPGYSTTAGQLGQYNFSSPAFPNAGNPGNVIGLMLSDMHFGQTNTSLRYWTEGIAPTRTFVLAGTYAQYTAAVSGGALTNVQLKLYETTGIVEVHIASSAATTARTVGLQDATKTIGAIAPGWNGRTTTLTTPQSFRFSPPANYTYSWSTSNANITPASSSAAMFNAVVSAPGAYTYNLIVTNPVTGCANDGQVTFTANETPQLSVSSQSNVTCYGGNNGSATVDVTGGTAPYTYSWAPSGGNAQTASGLTVGNYTVTVTDASLCSATTVLEITQPSPIVLSVISNASVTCFGGSNGSAEISATGGTGNYSYSWAPNGGSDFAANGLSAGTYTVTVTDDALCSQTITLTIGQPSNVQATVSSITDVSCFGGSDGSVTMNVSGGTSPYTYNWLPAGGTSATATGLTAGNYTFTATDANGCFTNTLVTVAEPSLLTVSINTTNPLCAGSNGGSATAVVSGGTPAYSYSWSLGGNNATVSNLSAGTYTVVVTDSKLCTAVSTLGIQDPVPMNITVDNTTNVTCHGGNNGAAMLSVSGGAGNLTYTWLPSGGNASSASGLTAGIYTVVVTDANACTGTVTVLIFEPAPFTASMSASTPVSCFGLSDASATVSTNGGQSPYTYAWSPTGGNAATASGLSAGNYVVTVTDASLCTATAVVSFTNPTQVAVDVLQSVDVSCFGGSNGSLDFSATGGSYPYTYSWTPAVSSSNAATGLNAGSYQVTVTDNNGCSASTVATINQPTLLEAVISNATDVTCFGAANGTATVNAVGGTTPYNYSWAPAGGSSNTATGLSAGTYTVTVTDANNCSFTGEVTINEGSSLSLTASSSDPACYGLNGQLYFSATGGSGTISYTVNNNLAISPMPALDGSYTIVATDANGCSAQSQLVISQPDLLTLSVSATDPNCNGENGNLSFSTIGGTGNISYSVNNNLATNPMVVSAGNYTVIASDANGCSAQEFASVTEPSAITITTSAVDALCNGGEGSINFSATGGTGFLNYDVNGLPQSSPMYGFAGTYTVTVVDGNSCSTVTTVSISEPALLDLSVSSTDALCNAGLGSISFTATGGTSPIGLYVDATPSISPFQAGVGTYLVEAIDANGCSMSTSVTINEPAPVQLTASSTDAQCSGGTGSITFSATGGNGNIAITVNGSPAVSPYTGLPDTYTIVATDANGCSAVTTVDIAEPLPISLSANVTNALCFGSNGTIDFFAYGGIGTIVYAVNGSPATSPYSASTGIYTITATDDNGCSAQTTVSVVDPTPMILTTSATDALCSGNDGIITFNATGGAGTVSFTVNGTSASSPYSGPAGAYTIIATDANGCTAQSVVTLNNPTAMSLISLVTNPLCNGTTGVLDFAATGGAGSINYTVNGTSAGSPYNASAGNYTVVATDINGCSIQTILSVVEPNAVTLIAQATDALCNGANGSMTFSASGGTGTIGYTVNGTAATSAYSAPVGNYTIVATDANGCSAQTVLAINEPALLTLTAFATDATCNGGNGVIQYSTTGGSPIVTVTINGTPTSSSYNAVAGTYTVLATDGNGCTAQSVLSVNEPSAISINVNTTNATCNGALGSISFSASGGTGNLLFLVNGNPSSSPLAAAAGIYTITVIDVNNCSAETTAIITEQSAVSIVATATNPLCNGSTGSINFSGTGGYGTLTYSVNGFPQTSPMIASAGTYSVQATDANGCTSLSVINIYEPTAITMISQVGDAICYGNNGSLNFAAGGGTGTLAYTVNGVPATSPSSQPVGNYTVVATDANGCSASTTMTINQPNPLVLTVSSTDALCNNGNGFINMTTTGGTGGIQYTANGNPVVNPSFQPAGNYTVIATDAGGCTSSATVTVSTPSAISLNVNSTDALCNGLNGSINYSVSGGTGSLTVYVNGAPGTNNMSVPASTYVVVAVDANACSVSSIVVVNQPSSVVVNASTTNALCNGGNGTISFNATGGTGAFTYQVNNVAATSNMLAPAGYYVITAIDANGCSANSYVNIGEPSAMSLIAGSTNALCNGGNGSINFTAGGGTGAITYTVNGSSASNNMSAAAGTYTVVATDANGCSAQTTVTVSQPSAVVLSASASNALCNGGNGSLSFNATGGTGSMTYTVNGNAATSPMTPTADNYTIVATDANGCSAQSVLNISQPSALTLSAGSTNALCNGGNGSINFSAGGGTGAITYTVNGNNASNNMSAAAGTYTVVATDANGCSAQTTVTVNQPSAVVLTASANNALCNGGNGSLSFNAIGGTGTIAYTVNGNSATSPMTPAAGNYTIVATDANGCSAQSVLSISQPSAVVLTASASDALCNNTNGTLIFAATGGTGTFNITVNGTSTTSPYNNSAGTYSIVATDANGCSAQTTVTINQPSAVVLTASASNAICNGGNGSLSFNATGGTGAITYTVNGNNASNNMSAVAGTYTVVATDANGCSAQTTVTVSQPSAVVISASASNALCNGGNGSLSFNATGGTGSMTYTVNGNAATSPMTPTAGNYTIVATDANGCSAQSVLTISQPSAIILSAGSTNALCNGGNGSINFTAGGGTGAITYIVNGNNASNNMSAAAGTYNVVATDANGCSAQTTVTVSQPNAVVISASASNALCNGGNGSLSFNATGGTGTIAYTVNGNSATSPTTLSAGSYTIVATDANGCSAQSVLNISQPSALTLSAGSTNALCNGGNGSINFTAGGGTGAITYTVNGSSASNNMSAAAGTYTVVATDANGCSAQTTVTVSQPSAVVISASASNALCNGGNGSLSFNAIGGTGTIAYTVNGNSATSPTTLSAGSYTIVATDANGCSAQSVLTISQPSAITLSAGSTNALCNGANGSINFTAGGGTGAITYTVNGNNASNNMSVAAGTYTIVATDANGCSAQTTETVNQPSAVVLTATATNPLCFGSNGTLSFSASGGTGAMSYTINGNNANSPASRSAGTYTIVAADANGCSAQTVLTISQPSALTMAASGTNALCSGTNGSISFTVTGGTGAITTTVNGTPTLSPSSVGAGSYVIVATDINNCTVQTTVTVSIPSALNLTANANNVVCAGGNGSLTFNATGGTGNKVYTVNGIVRTSPFTTVAGTYTIVATDANGCSASAVRTITTINALPTVSLGSDVMICQGGSTNLNISFTGNSPWVYSINGGAPQVSASNSVSITVNPILSTQYIITSLSDATCSNTITDSVWVNTQPCGNLMPLITSTLNYTVTYKIASQPYATIATNSPTSYTASGLPAGLTMTTATGVISGTTTDLPGVYPVVVSAINQYGSDTKTLMITVNPRQLTISGLSVNSKVYDATTTASLSGTPNLVGRAFGDVVNVLGTPVADFNNSQVGIGKPVAVSGFTLSGTHAAYYTLTQPSLNGTINGRPASVSGVTAGSKVYDGITNTTIIGTPVAVGLIPGDAVSLNTFGAAANFVTPTHGYNKQVNFTGYALVGASASNYIFSQPASVVADIICASPTILSIVPTGNQATVSWVGGALNYSLEYREAGTQNWSVINTTASSALITGLTTSTLYEVRLRLSCVSGVMSNYVTGSFTTTSGCSIPSLTAPVVSGNSGKINWNGSADSIYQVTFRQLGQLTWNPTINQTVKNRTFTALTVNTTYEYRVRSICKNGDVSVWVNGQFTTTAGCGVPSLLAPVPYGNSAKVSWTGSTDSIFQVSVKLTSSLVWGTSINTNTLNRTLTGLTVNTAYDYQVRSICKNGDISIWVSGQFTTTSGCGIPTLNAPTAISGNSATANWNGSSDSIYQIMYKPANTAAWSQSTNTVTLSNKLTGLMVNTTYDYQVRSVCKSGDASIWVAGQFTTNAGCGLPILNAPTAINGNSATVNWTSFSDSVHQISFKLASSATWGLPTLAPGTSRQLTGLTVNTVYNYRLRSICKNGDISDWVVGTFTTNSGCPTVTLNTPIVSSTSAVISWSNVQAISYDAGFKLASATLWYTLGNNPTTTRTILGLQPNTTYNYRVRSSCSNADMSAYIIGTFTTPATKDNNAPFAMLFNVNGTLNNDGNADVSWSSLSEWQVSGYEIEHRVGDNPFMPMATVSSKAIDGKSDDVLEYQTTHTSVPYGLNQYRLWIIGLDGSRTLHNNVISLRKSPFETTVNAYPNPASSLIHLTVNTNKTHPVDIKFLDATGRTIKAMSVSVQPGINDIPVDIDALPVALYTIAVYREGALIYTGRFQKVH